jgi:hypothetical protein
MQRHRYQLLIFRNKSILADGLSAKHHVWIGQVPNSAALYFSYLFVISGIEISTPHPVHHTSNG